MPWPSLPPPLPEPQLAWFLVMVLAVTVRVAPVPTKIPPPEPLPPLPPEWPSPPSARLSLSVLWSRLTEELSEEKPRKMPPPTARRPLQPSRPTSRGTHAATRWAPASRPAGSSAQTSSTSFVEETEVVATFGGVGSRCGAGMSEKTPDPFRCFRLPCHTASRLLEANGANSQVASSWVAA
jgi:hypothetical protein